MTPIDIVFTVIILALGVANYYAARSYFRWRRATAAAAAELQRQETATAIRNARRAGYLQGSDRTMQIWGAHVRTINQMDMHGFAETCRKCGTITLSLISTAEEYWSCDQCQHRNPAPLPPHMRTQPAATHDPAEHHDP
jgi:formamidopyrimidine-DNA glycosylase